MAVFSSNIETIKNFQKPDYAMKELKFYSGCDNDKDVSDFIVKLIYRYIQSISYNKDILMIMSFIYVRNYTDYDRKNIISSMIDLYEEDRKKYFKDKYSMEVNNISDATKEIYTKFLSIKFIQHNQIYSSNIFGPINYIEKIDSDSNMNYTYTEGEKFVTSFKIALTNEPFNNAQRELLNFVALAYKLQRKQFTITDFIGGIYIKKFGISLGMSVNTINILKKSFIIKNENRILDLDNKQLISLLNSFDNTNNPNFSWSKSAILTSEEIIRKNIFDKNSDYTFYSEESSFYKSLYNEFLKKIKSSINLDAYLKQLNINKFFISDVIAVKRSSNCINELKRMISEANSLNNQDFIKIVNRMDEYFDNKELIPISLKKIQSFTSDTRYVKEVANIGSMVKIINPPAGYSNRAEKYDIDDLDYLVLKLIKDVKELPRSQSLNTLLENNNYIEIDYNSFRYNTNLYSKTYGGLTDEGNVGYDNLYNLYFIFTAKIKDKRRKYTFEIRPGSIYIRTLGTASASGEGSINTSSLNYVMKKIYSYEFNPQLKKLADARVAHFDRALAKLKVNLQDSEVKSLYNKYRQILSRNAVINSGSYDKFNQIFQKIFIIYSNESQDMINLKLVCIDAYLSYLRSIAKAANKNIVGLPPENYVELEKKYIENQLNKLPKLLEEKTEVYRSVQRSKVRELKNKSTKNAKKLVDLKYKDVSKILSNTNLDLICAYEIGLLLKKNTSLNYSVEVDGKKDTINLTFNLSEADKKKLILTEWGLISARGVIIFKNKKFKSANEIEDVLKSKLKMPALLKIGV